MIEIVRGKRQRAIQLCSQLSFGRHSGMDSFYVRLIKERAALASRDRAHSNLPSKMPSTLIGVELNIIKQRNPTLLSRSASIRRVSEACRRQDGICTYKSQFSTALPRRTQLGRTYWRVRRHGQAELNFHRRAVLFSSRQSYKFRLTLKVRLEYRSRKLLTVSRC